ncbi:MAG: hypothetical protein JGK33_08840 [Microcoleus sp. PH2017_11_PCY_U_A]|nr:hypothetical protein [Microcoleus sp. PH2017_11_PCY_U_A]
MTNFCDSKTAEEILNCSKRTLIRYRQQQRLLEGIHWGRNPSGKVVYNADLIKNLVMCGGSIEHPDHEKFIQQYLDSLPENQPRQKKGRATAAV